VVIGLSPRLMERRNTRKCLPKHPPVLGATKEAPPRSAKKVVLAGLCALTAVLVLFFVLNVGGLRDWLLGRTSTRSFRSLAVLPLANLSSDPAQDYFADGMTEELITQFSKLGDLKVISRTSVMQYKGTRKSLPQMTQGLIHY